MWKTVSLRAFCTSLVVMMAPVTFAGSLEDGITALDSGRYRAAYEAFLKGAKAGNTEAQVQLAIILLDGTTGRKDPKGAAEWLERAANRGDAYAMYRLGTLFEEGIAGKPDASAAARWYEKAVQRGEPNAAYRLARLYDKGVGVAVNPDRALALYREAALGGVLKADHTLGSMLVSGRKGTADIIEGATWLELAWQGGDGDVIDELNKLRATLTAAQRAAVKSRVEAHLRKSPHH